MRRSTYIVPVICILTASSAWAQFGSTPPGYSEPAPKRRVGLLSRLFRDREPAYRPASAYPTGNPQTPVMSGAPWNAEPGGYLDSGRMPSIRQTTVSAQQPGAKAPAAPPAPAPAPKAEAGAPTSKYMWNLEQPCRISPPEAACPVECGECGDMWARGEYLLWSLRGMNVPPLVTTSPPGTPREQAGVLGQPGTIILFGGDQELEEPRHGGRLTAGMLLDRCTGLSLEGSVFYLEDVTEGFFAASDANGNPILMRPFTDAEPGTSANAAEVVSYPGQFAGSVAVDLRSSLLGAELNLRQPLLCPKPCYGKGEPCDDCKLHRLDLIGGYRYLRLRESLDVREDITAIDPQNPLIIPGTRFEVWDAFQARSQFHGGQIGLVSETRYGNWGLELTGKIGLGWTIQDVGINGSNRVTVPGSPPSTTPGGLLAQPTNMGRFNDSQFSVVPEVGARLIYHVNECVNLSAGYSFLYWDHVVRPGDQIDLTVNSSQIGGAPLNGLPRPLFGFKDTSVWLQGITVGLELKY